MKGNATTVAPRELLGVYAKHCPLGHVIEIGAEACGICVLIWQAEDRRAKDLEAGRVGEDPDYEEENEP